MHCTTSHAIAVVSNLQNLSDLLLQRQFVLPNQVLDRPNCPLHKPITLAVPMGSMFLHSRQVSPESGDITQRSKIVGSPSVLNTTLPWYPHFGTSRNVCLAVHSTPAPWNGTECTM